MATLARCLGGRLGCLYASVLIELSMSGSALPAPPVLVYFFASHRLFLAEKFTHTQPLPRRRLVVIVICVGVHAVLGEGGVLVVFLVRRGGRGSAHGVDVSPAVLRADCLSCLKVL